MSEPKCVPYSELIEGHLYDVFVASPGLAANLTLPFRGRDEDDPDYLVFADGPNGVAVSIRLQPQIYRFEDTL